MSKIEEHDSRPRDNPRNPLSWMRRELRSAHDVFGVHSNPRNTFGCFIYFRPDTPNTISKQRASLKVPPVSTTNSYNASKRDGKHTNNTEYQYSTKSEEMRVFYQFAAPRNPVQTGKAKRKLHNFVAQRYRCSQRSLAQNTHHPLTTICSLC